MSYEFFKGRMARQRTAGPGVFRVRYIVLFLLMACLSLLALVAWERWKSRQYHLHDAEVAMSNLAQTLASQAQASIKQADTVLFTLVDRLEVEGMAPGEIPRIQRLLWAQRSELPQIHGLFVYDAQGTWVANAIGATPPNGNNTDREYFIFHRDHADRGPHIGPVIKSRSTGDWVLTVSRRIEHPDGSFAGVVLATLYVDHFLALYDGIDLGADGVISMISADAKIQVRYPVKEEMLGSDISKGVLFTRLLPASSSGAALITSYVDKLERVVGFQRVEEYPLIIFVGQTQAHALVGWRKDSLLSAVIGGLLLLIIGLLGYRLIGLLRQQGRIQYELLSTQEQLLEANRSLESLALEDALTGLANRRRFDLFIQAQMANARRNKESLALLMIDVDSFKAFNDHYGHLAGDQCLRRIGAIIGQHVRRPSDLAARYGGEEFAVLLPGIDWQGALSVAEKIRHAVLAAHIEHSVNVQRQVTVSLGISACVPGAGDLPETLIEAADRALYRAKSTGRNQSLVAGE